MVIMAERQLPSDGRVNPKIFRAAVMLTLDSTQVPCALSPSLAWNEF